MIRMMMSSELVYVSSRLFTPHKEDARKQLRFYLPCFLGLREVRTRGTRPTETVTQRATQADQTAQGVRCQIVE